jgi:hypothetical protein
MPDHVKLGEFAQERELANEVVRRAVADASYRERLRASPQEVLEEAGVRKGLAEDVAREILVDGNPAPDIRCSDTCDWTCFWTTFSS